MFGLGPIEIFIILGILLIFFGGKLIPRIGKNLGDTIRELRHFSKPGEDEDTVPPQKSKSDRQ